MKEHQPPKYILQFFRWFCHPDYAEDIEGDLHEKYERYLTQYKKRKANWYFLIAVVSLLRPELIKPLNIYHTLISNIMLRNNLKIAGRGLIKNKSFSALIIEKIASKLIISNYVQVLSKITVIV